MRLFKTKCSQHSELVSLLFRITEHEAEYDLETEDSQEDN